MNKKLTSQIVLHILGRIGISNFDDPKTWNGLGSAELITDKYMKIKYPEKEVDHTISAGKLSINNFEMKGILIDLSYTENEVLFVFRSGDKPIHAISCIGDGFISFIKIFNDKSNIWKDATIQMQAQILAAFEQLSSLGLLWDHCDKYDDLYKASVNLVSSLE
jgi:hypothetical protein